MEFATAIITYAASTQSLRDEPSLCTHPYPVVKNYTDNTATESWTKKSVTCSDKGRALGLIYSNLLRGNNLSSNSFHLAGVLNVLADKISRLSTPHTPPNFQLLTQEFPQLNHCKRFRPSPVLVSSLLQGLLSGLPPTLVTHERLGHFDPANNGGVTSV